MIIGHTVRLFHWYYIQLLTLSDDIASAVLPELGVHDEIPSGFTLVGHVAHLNLREHYHPYKHIIG